MLFVCFAYLRKQVAAPFWRQFRDSNYEVNRAGTVRNRITRRRLRGSLKATGGQVHKYVGLGRGKAAAAVRNLVAYVWATHVDHEAGALIQLDDRGVVEGNGRVYHKDGDTLNNSVSNLVVRPA